MASIERAHADGDLEQWADVAVTIGFVADATGHLWPILPLAAPASPKAAPAEPAPTCQEPQSDWLRCGRPLPCPRHDPTCAVCREAIGDRPSTQGYADGLWRHDTCASEPPAAPPQPVTMPNELSLWMHEGAIVMGLPPDETSTSSVLTTLVSARLLPYVRQLLAAAPPHGGPDADRSEPPDWYGVEPKSMAGNGTLYWARADLATPSRERADAVAACWAHYNLVAAPAHKRATAAESRAREAEQCLIDTVERLSLERVREAARLVEAGFATAAAARDEGHREGWAKAERFYGWTPGSNTPAAPSAPQGEPEPTWRTVCDVPECGLSATRWCENESPHGLPRIVSLCTGHWNPAAAAPQGEAAALLQGGPGSGLSLHDRLAERAEALRYYFDRAGMQPLYAFLISEVLPALAAPTAPKGPAAARAFAAAAPLQGGRDVTLWLGGPAGPDADGDPCVVCKTPTLGLDDLAEAIGDLDGAVDRFMVGEPKPNDDATCPDCEGTGWASESNPGTGGGTGRDEQIACPCPRGCPDPDERAAVEQYAERVRALAREPYQPDVVTLPPAAYDALAAQRAIPLGHVSLGADGRFTTVYHNGQAYTDPVPRLAAEREPMAAADPVHLGSYEADSREAALDAMSRCAPRPIPVDEQDGESCAPPVSPVSLRQTIATAVYLRRRALGLSRRALAERCGVSLDTVLRVEADDDDPRARAPSVGVLERLAGGLGVPVAALVSEQNDVPSIVHK